MSLSPENDSRAVGTTAETPPPDKVNQFHRYDDVDNSPEAHHHTLGADINQSSPGNHSHDGRDSSVLSEYSVSIHSHDAASVEVTPVGTLASITVQDALSELDGEKSPIGHTHPADDNQTALEVPFTPAGSIAAVNVQAAIVELDTEKSGIAHIHDPADLTGLPINVTGDRSAGTALENLLTALATAGIITDSTVA